MSANSPHVLWFEKVGRGDVAKVGGKNASLGEIPDRFLKAQTGTSRAWLRMRSSKRPGYRSISIRSSARKPNEALQLTAVPLRFTAATEFRR